VTDQHGDPPGHTTTASATSWALRDLLLSAAVANQEIARRLGLSLSDLTALDHLLAGEPLGTGELAQRLGMRSPSATAVLDRLESAGHVRRVSHPTDRRRVVIEATDDGKARSEDAVQPLIDELDRLAEQLGEREQELVTSFLTQAASVLRSYGRPD
jgi:DNA-binding MarR family transcriptional regulator